MSHITDMCTSFLFFIFFLNSLCSFELDFNLSPLKLVFPKKWPYTEYIYFLKTVSYKWWTVLDLYFSDFFELVMLNWNLVKP
jgi:hypothetical protein